MGYADKFFPGNLDKFSLSVYIVLIVLSFYVFQTSRMFGSSAYRDCLASVTGIKFVSLKVCPYNISIFGHL